MNIAGSGAAVTVRIDDLTGPGLRSALKNLSRLEQASKDAAAAAVRSTSMVRQVAGRGLVMQPFAGAESRLDLLGGPGGAFVSPTGPSNPYEIENPVRDAMMRRAQERSSREYGAREVGFMPPAFVKNSRTVAEAMRLAASSAGELDGRMGRLTGVSGKFATRIAGVGIAFSATSSIFAAAIDAIEDKARGASDSFFSAFQLRLIESVRSIPVIGAAIRAVFADQYAEIDRIKKATEELVQVGERQRALVEARQQGSQASRSRLAESRLDLEEARIESSSAGFETESSVEALRKVERERARLRSEQFAREQAERARAEGVSEESVGIGGERYRQIQAETQELYRNELDAIDAAFDRRISAVVAEREARRRASEEEAREEQRRQEQIAARAEELALDQQDRLALARLDSQEAAVGDEDTLANRVRRAEIEASRQLINLQQQLDEAESRIVEEKGLTEAQRQQAIAAEREIAQLQAENIRAAVDRARQGEEEVAKVTATASGTFSAIAAARTVTTTQQLAEKQLAALKQIATNTAQQAGFTP